MYESLCLASRTFTFKPLLPPVSLRLCFIASFQLWYFPPSIFSEVLISFFPCTVMSSHLSVLNSSFLPNTSPSAYSVCVSLSLLPSVLLSSRLSSHQACKVNQPWVTTHDPVGHSHITPCTGQSTLLRVCLKQSDGEQRKIKRIWRNKNDNLRWDRLGCQEKCKVKKTSVSLLLPEKTGWDVEQKESGDVRNSTWWLESRSI